MNFKETKMQNYYRKIDQSNFYSDVNAFEALKNSKIMPPIIDSVFSPLVTVSNSKCPGGSVKILLENNVKAIFYARNSCLSYDILNLATFYLDRLLGLFHYPPCVIRTLTSEEQLTAKFPQDLGGDRKDNFYDYKNHEDGGSLTGLLCLNVPLKPSNDLKFPLLSKFTSGVVPPSNVQKSQVEYFILSILASIEPVYANFKKNGVRDASLDKKSKAGDDQIILTGFTGGNLEYKKYNSIVNFEHVAGANTAISSSTANKNKIRYDQFLRQKPYFLHKIEDKTLQQEPISEPLTVLRNCNFPKAMYNRLQKIQSSKCSLGNRIRMFTENSFSEVSNFYNFTEKLYNIWKDLDTEVSISKRIDDNVGIFQNIVDKCLKAHGSENIFY